MSLGKGIDRGTVTTEMVATLVLSALAATRSGWAAALRLRAPLLALGAAALFAATMVSATGLAERFAFSLAEVVARNAAVLASSAALFAGTLAQLRRLARPEALRSRAWRPLIVPALAALGLPAALWALTPIAARPTLGVTNPRNVVLIGIDTLRADHTTLLGAPPGGRDLTPNLRELASRGVVFQDAVSQSSWTLPSFASILTGKYPQQHGAMFLTGTLREEETTLAEALREAGYATGAVVSHFFVDSRHGFSQGFEHFDEYYDPLAVHSFVSSKGVTNRAIRFLDRHAGERLFLFVQYFDPHYDYMDHAEWSFADDYAGWLREDPRDIYNLNAKRHLLEAPEMDYLRSLYDEDIAFTDAEIGRLIRWIDAAGLSGDTAIVVVADHGEEFLERGALGHTISLNEEIVRVPLLMVLPGQAPAGAVVEAAVETRAVFGTVLDYLGIALPGAAAPSLLPAIGGAADPSVPVFSSVWMPPDRADVGKSVYLSSMRSGRFKLIVDHLRKREFLYDLSVDPGETVNLAEKEPEKLAELLVVLEAWVEEMRATGVEVPRFDPSDELRDKLRALGYL
jgi:arylsulfatase A-like enzyme